jgi:hypothetical protein
MCLKNLLIFLISFVIAAFFGIKVHAAPNERVAVIQESVQGPKESNNAVPLNKEQEIVLSPFFQLQNKGSIIGIERIFVTLLMTMPKDSVKYDFNSPTFRKMFYDLLQSEKMEFDIQSQVVANLSRQFGFNINASVHVSRSFIIVH